ncbi:MAG: hypothetical protein Phog2KO_32800 [Phototrophicaceae bacterium]
MRLKRNPSRTIFRRNNPWQGCFFWLISISLLFVFAFIAKDRIQDWFTDRLYPIVGLAQISDAQLAFAQGDLDRTIAYAQEIYANSPTDVTALELLVRTLVYRSYEDLNQEADREQALALTNSAVEQNPYNMRVLGIHAFALQSNNYSEDAQRVALRVIRNDEHNISARLALSLSYASQGIFSAALRDGQRAIEIANTLELSWRADAYRVLAIAHSDLGQYDLAARHVETAISFNNRLIPLHFERALYAQQLGDMDTATVYYFNVIAFDDENAKAYFRMCEVSSLLGERIAAIGWCQQVVEILPGWAEGWYWLGREYYLNGDWENTQSSLNRCSTLEVAQGVTNENRRFECWYIQGQAAEVLGDCVALLALYQEYRQMALSADLPQTWVYPDDMPTICATPTTFPQG